MKDIILAHVPGMFFSLHRSPVPIASKDLVGDNHFLLTAPPILVTPDVAPVEEVGHGCEG